MHRTLVVLALTLALGGCGTQGDDTASDRTATITSPSESTASTNSTPLPASPGEPTATQITVDPLAETGWVLVSLDGAPPSLDPVIRLEFQGGFARGFAGCNFFDGPYRLADATLRLREVAQTAMLCQDEALMRWESAFFDALRATDTYALQGETLELRDGSGATRLVFRAQERQATDPTRLHDTHWQLESIAGSAPAGARLITLELTDAGQARGDAGCRTYAATWQAEADRIDFPIIKMIGELCADQDLLEQEGAFTDALSTAHSYRLADGQLELIADRNGPLRFVHLP